MTALTGKKMATHQNRYLDVAVEDEVCTKRGRNMLRLMYEPAVEKPMIFEPDEDFYSSITADEFKERALEIVEKVHHKFYGNERKICPGND